jgi:hypothetical protein
MSIVVFPRRQPWRRRVAEIHLRKIVRELKKQRRQIERAIAALEPIIPATRERTRARKKRKDSTTQRPSWTLGKVVPFRRRT